MQRNVMDFKLPYEQVCVIIGSLNLARLTVV